MFQFLAGDAHHHGGRNQTLMLATVHGGHHRAHRRRRPWPYRLYGSRRLDVGNATAGGVGIVLLAIILDRITQALGDGRRVHTVSLWATLRGYFRPAHHAGGLEKAG